jgi:circadian clock protein KaiA
MLLPILIWQRRFNKCLDNATNLFHKKGLRLWIYKFIYPVITQFSYLPAAVTTSGTITYLPDWLQTNLNQLDSGKYLSVFASHIQKSQQQFHDMTLGERQELLNGLKSDYSQIIIDYFTTDKTLKEKIDKFINTIFYANIPVPQIIEIHMEVIDEFSKQLRLEGRSDETLLDYRLTLIDILAHLCEVYRCSISK